MTNHSNTPATNTNIETFFRGDVLPENRKKITILTLKKHKRDKIKTVLVTAYDYPQAILADRAGVDVILVGDSLGMTTLGYKTTIPVTMEQMLNACKSVWRANKSAFLVGDMPFMSYQESDELAGTKCWKIYNKWNGRCQGRGGNG